MLDDGVLAIVALWPTALAGVVMLSRHAGTLGNASFELLDDATGVILARSPLTFAFMDPLLETCAGGQAFYAVSVAVGAGSVLSSTLSQLGAGTLDVERQWLPPATGGFAYFDLQWSRAAGVLIGIAVNGSGRVLSRFDISGPAVSATPLVVLPSMWFVNASTFDAAGDAYYGLLKQYPYSAEPGMRLLVAHISARASVVYSVVAPSGVLLYFVSYSGASGTLFALADVASGGGATLGSLTLDAVAGTATWSAITAMGGGSGTSAATAPLYTATTAGGGGSACAVLGDDAGGATLSCYDIARGVLTRSAVHGSGGTPVAVAALPVNQ